MARDTTDEQELDARLLGSWAGGDARAGEELFDRHVDAVVRFFENKVLRDSEDLVQTTFLRMLDGRDRIRDGASIRVYLLGVARNVLREHLRKLARGREVDLEVDTMVRVTSGPSSIVGAREEHQLLLDGLRHLPIDDQILIELFYWEGLDSGALGEIVGMPASSVRTRLSRIRERLKGVLEDLSTAPAVLSRTVERMDDWAAELRARLRKDDTPPS